MTAHSQALRAYGQASNPMRTPRGVEYELFARVTHRLIAAAKKGKAAGFAELAQAIYDNRKLWTTLAADVAGKDNKLPQSLRAQIFYLAEFTNEHSRKVLRNEGNILPLVEINSMIMRGLRKEGSQK